MQVAATAAAQEFATVIVTGGAVIVEELRKVAASDAITTISNESLPPDHRNHELHRRGRRERE
ncbi:MAG: hypothetical protein DIU71_01450 [Proteobacteria bacterium]|nr:MAG: hypothetical protein DIU71_01450 [Pseudomonadota bacterium]